MKEIFHERIFTCDAFFSAFLIIMQKMFDFDFFERFVIRKCLIILINVEWQAEEAYEGRET